MQQRVWCVVILLFILTLYVSTKTNERYADFDQFPAAFAPTIILPNELQYKSGNQYIMPPPVPSLKGKMNSTCSFQPFVPDCEPRLYCMTGKCQPFPTTTFW